uniref:Uncharacterized protein n=1 Tax=Oryza sativa subsp. japonica TaxID=39947 RepID=Q69N70_ORYSJ|nr:hypothetical protein [Oryza sativa Japonica Group]
MGWATTRQRRREARGAGAATRGARGAVTGRRGSGDARGAGGGDGAAAAARDSERRRDATATARQRRRATRSDDGTRRQRRAAARGASPSHQLTRQRPVFALYLWMFQHSSQEIKYKMKNPSATIVSLAFDELLQGFSERQHAQGPHCPRSILNTRSEEYLVEKGRKVINGRDRKRCLVTGKISRSKVD